MKAHILQKLTAAAAAAVFAFTPAAAPGAAATAGGGSSRENQSILDLRLPSLGTVAGADLSIIEERSLGESLMKRVRSDPSYMADEEAFEYLNRLGYQLVAASNTLPYSFFFFPIRDRSLNAFALPGGFIAVHSGLIVAAETESELAGVIGHEIGHVTQRHIARMIEQGKSTLAMTLGSFLLALLAARAGGSSGGDAAMAVVVGSQAAMIQNQLGYSRDAEREADRVGLASLYNAGFDPRGMESFFGKLHRKNRQYETASTAYLSTHPLSSERMNDMQLRTRMLPEVRHEDSLDFILLKTRMKVLQETRQDGWNAVARSFREQLKKTSGRQAAAAHYGLSLVAARLKEPGEALDQARLALRLAGSQNVILDKNLVEAHFALAATDQEKEAALKLARETAERHSFSAMAAKCYADLLYKAGKNNEVVSFLRHQEAVSHTNADYHMLLARSYQALGQHSLAFAATGDMYAVLGNDDAALYQYDLAQRANDADYYVMSEIDAKLRELRRKVRDDRKKD